MPQTPDQWLWFWFFAGGAAGGWVVLIIAIAQPLRLAALVFASIRNRKNDHANSR